MGGCPGLEPLAALDVGVAYGMTSKASTSRLPEVRPAAVPSKYTDQVPPLLRTMSSSCTAPMPVHGRVAAVGQVHVRGVHPLEAVDVGGRPADGRGIDHAGVRSSPAVPAVDVGVVTATADAGRHDRCRRSRSRASRDDADRIQVGAGEAIAAGAAVEDTATTCRRCRRRRPRPGPSSGPGSGSSRRGERQIELCGADAHEAVHVGARRQRVRDRASRPSRG